MASQTNDSDAQETREWLEALDSVMEQEGVERAHFLLEKLIARARGAGAYLPYSANTAYVNTIPRQQRFAKKESRHLYRDFPQRPLERRRLSFFAKRCCRRIPFPIYVLWKAS